MISDEPYRTSSQYKKFSYPSKEALYEQRAQNTRKSAAQLSSASGSGGSVTTAYLTTEEEAELVDFYIGRLWNFCGLFKVSSNVKIAATAFLLRYYIHNTPLTTHPKHLILTALFLAAKTENAFIPLESFKSRLPSNVDTTQLTSLEFPLSSGMQFSFTVWSCLRPLWGFSLEFIDFVNDGAINYAKEDVRRIMNEAREWALESLRTDAQFLYTPPQIALACIFHFEKELVRDFLGLKFPPGSALTPVKEGEKKEDAAEMLLRVIEECDELISERLNIIRSRTKQETVTLVTNIDKRLYQCRKLLDSSASSAADSGSDTAAKRKADSSEDRESKKPRADQ